MTLELVTTRRFEKNLKKMVARGKDKAKIRYLIEQLLQRNSLLPKYKDHLLVGKWQGFRECHIESDWLLIYKVEGSELLLADTGTHADLF